MGRCNRLPPMGTSVGPDQLQLLIQEISDQANAALMPHFSGNISGDYSQNGHRQYARTSPFCVQLFQLMECWTNKKPSGQTGPTKGMFWGAHAKPVGYFIDENPSEKEDRYWHSYGKKTYIYWPVADEKTKKKKKAWQHALAPRYSKGEWVLCWWNAGANLWQVFDAANYIVQIKLKQKLKACGKAKAHVMGCKCKQSGNGNNNNHGGNTGGGGNTGNGNNKGGNGNGGGGKGGKGDGGGGGSGSGGGPFGIALMADGSGSGGGGGNPNNPTPNSNKNGGNGGNNTGGGGEGNGGGNGNNQNNGKCAKCGKGLKKQGEIVVYDSLGVVGQNDWRTEIDKYCSKKPREKTKCPAAAKGILGWAIRRPDSNRWAVLSLGQKQKKKKCECHLDDILVRFRLEGKLKPGGSAKAGQLSVKCQQQGHGGGGGNGGNGNGGGKNGGGGGSGSGGDGGGGNTPDNNNVPTGEVVPGTPGTGTGNSNTTPDGSNNQPTGETTPGNSDTGVTGDVVPGDMDWGDPNVSPDGSNSATGNADQLGDGISATGNANQLGDGISATGNADGL